MRISYFSRFFTIIFLIIISTLAANAGFKKEPILDSDVLPGYYFHGLDYYTEEISDLLVEDPQYGVIKNTKSIKILAEKWMTITENDFWNNWRDRKKRKNNLKNSGIQVERFYLNNREDAIEWAKLKIESGQKIIPANDARQYKEWTEGGYSIQKIGDNCWSDKNSAHRIVGRKKNGVTICFVKGNVFSIVSGAGPEEIPMDPRFVEKIAQKVAERL